MYTLINKYMYMYIHVCILRKVQFLNNINLNILDFLRMASYSHTNGQQHGQEQPAVHGHLVSSCYTAV